MSIQVTSTTESPEAVAAALSSLAKKETDVEANSVSDSLADSDESQESSREASQESDDQELENDSDDQQDEEEVESEEDSKPKKKGGFKKRIERFQKEISSLKNQIASYENGKKETEAKVSSKSNEFESEKPKAENFETHEEFVDALTDWKIQQRENQKEAKVKADAAKSEYQKQVDAFQKKASEFKKSVNDFDDVISDVDDINLSFALHDSLITSDLGPQILYDLSKNRKELERINSLGPIETAREIGKLEAKLDKISSSKQEIKTTKAPAPLSAVGSRSGSSIAKSIHDPNITFAEYERIRMQELNKKYK